MPRRRRERPAKQLQQLAALSGCQLLEDVVLDFSGQGPSALYGPAPIRRDRDLASAAVLGVRPALGQAGTLELVDNGDHRARVDPHRRTDLLLDRSFSNDPDKPIRKYNKRELHDLLYKEPTKIKVEGINLTYCASPPESVPDGRSSER